MATDFYWRHARDSLLTERALRLFQIVALHNGEVFSDAKLIIDNEYQLAVGNANAPKKHGGIIQTQIQVFREAGWVTLSASPSGDVIQITPAGNQALLLLSKVPDFLKAAPYFVVELLARFQLNNPSRPDSARNAEYDAELAKSTIFPYWTLLKIIRSLDDRIEADELRRFVFKIQQQEQVQSTIEKIREFRKDVAVGVSQADLDTKYGAPLDGSVGEPKYLMGRLGTQVGAYPALIEKDGATTWVLNKNYANFVDFILSNEPEFRENLTEETWIQDYGSAVDIDKYYETIIHDTTVEPLETDLPDDDEILLSVQELLAEGARAILLSGPPGTSKTWYARKLAGKLVDGNGTRAKFVQFHPSLGYDDFVEGYVPTDTGGRGTFEVVDKTFLKLCAIARQSAPELCVLVIDEVNRGDLGRILGELLTYIEPGYRGKQFQLAYSGRTISIPENLVLLGTFNPFDKSVVELDDAIDRRFDRISLEPSPEKLKQLLTESNVNPQLIERLTKFFAEVNVRMRHGIGHAIFLGVKDDVSLRRLWKRKLQFIFEKSFRFEADGLSVTKNAYVQVFADPEQAGI